MKSIFGFFKSIIITGGVIVIAEMAAETLTDIYKNKVYKI